MLVARERESRVDHEHLASGLVDGHVLADLAEAAQRDDPEGVAHLDECMRVRLGTWAEARAEDVECEQVVVEPLAVDCDIAALLDERIQGGKRRIIGSPSIVSVRSPSTTVSSIVCPLQAEAAASESHRHSRSSARPEAARPRQS